MRSSSDYEVEYAEHSPAAPNRCIGIRFLISPALGQNRGGQLRQPGRRMRVLDVPAAARGTRPQSHGTLSVVCMTAGPGPRVAAILELLRPVATEIIVSLDDRADREVLDAVAAAADRVIAYPFAHPVDRPLPWLFRQCRSEWLLTIDDDEVPSVDLLDVLPELCANDE